MSQWQIYGQRGREKGRWRDRETKTNVYYFKFRVDQFYCARNWAKVCSYRTGGWWGVSAPFWPWSTWSIHQFLWRPSECRRGKNIKTYAMHATYTWPISDAVPPLPSLHKLQYALALSENNNQNSLVKLAPGRSSWVRLRHPVSTNLMVFALLLLLQLICIAVVWLY